MPSDAVAQQPWYMTKGTAAEGKRPQAVDEAAHDDDHHGHLHDDRPGIDLPVVGHVPYKSVAFFAGLGVAGAAGVIEWPVAAAVGLGYALARR
jgi:hypothetical protein